MPLPTEPLFAEPIRTQPFAALLTKLADRLRQHPITQSAFVSVSERRLRARRVADACREPQEPNRSKWWQRPWPARVLFRPPGLLRLRKGKAAMLERKIKEIFGDEAPTGFGTGWWSGVLSAFFGLLAFGAVLCLHFPELLTSPELRPYYPMFLMRLLIQAVIVSAIVLGVVSAMQIG